MQVLCYADDTLVIAEGKKWTRTLGTNSRTAAVAVITTKIEDLGLKIAAQKTESLWIDGLLRSRRPPPT